jgi:hypothetical protein
LWWPKVLPEWRLTRQTRFEPIIVQARNKKFFTERLVKT